MEKTIDVYSKLKEAPRPHYLIGEAFYDFVNDTHTLRAVARFSSDYPSILDRAKARIPHVNLGDACFGLWNAIYLIADQNGASGTLVEAGGFEALRRIPPDRDIILEARVTEVKEDNKKLKANFEGTYSLNGVTLFRIYGNGLAIQK